MPLRYQVKWVQQELKTWVKKELLIEMGRCGGTRVDGLQKEGVLLQEKKLGFFGNLLPV